MIRIASADTVVVGAHILKEGVMAYKYIGYAGVVTRVVGKRVYHRFERDGEIHEKFSSINSMRFVADSESEAEGFKDWHNKSLMEVKRKIDGFSSVLHSDHAAEVAKRVSP